jgi:hypothetical protein
MSIHCTFREMCFISMLMVPAFVGCRTARNPLSAFSWQTQSNASVASPSSIPTAGDSVDVPKQADEVATDSSNYPAGEDPLKGFYGIEPDTDVASSERQGSFPLSSSSGGSCSSGCCH